MGRSLLLLAALPATSIGGNPLGPRYSGLVFGVALGLLVATYTRLSYAMQLRAAHRTAKQGMPKKRRPGTHAPASVVTPVSMPMPASANSPARNDGHDTLSRYTSA
jgi:hypothetical protein